MLLDNDLIGNYEKFIKLYNVKPELDLILPTEYVVLFGINMTSLK